METWSGTITGVGGLRLFYQGWLPDADPKARLAICIGLAEHGGRYAHVGAALAARGFAVWALDLQGHGRSEGVRGFVERYDIYVEDTATFLAQIAPAPKTFLYGHSMGASTALRLAELYPERVDGLVLTGTTLQAGEFVPAWMIAAASVLSASTPRLRLVAIPAGELSHDPAVNAAYDSDPLVFRGKFTARLGAEILRINAHLLKRVGEITTPMLIMHGAEDRITNVNGARALYECAGAPDKTLKIWEGMYHEIHNEPAVKDAVIAMIGDWMEARL